MTQLTDRWTLEQLAVTTHAEFVARNLWEAAKYADRLKELALHFLHPVQDHFGFRPVVTSCFRYPELNTAVAGRAPGSQHTTQNGILTGAVDILTLNLETTFAWMAASLTYHQLILEDNGVSKWIHAGMPTGYNDGQQIKMDAVTKKKLMLRVAYKEVKA